MESVQSGVEFFATLYDGVLAGICGAQRNCAFKTAGSAVDTLEGAMLIGSRWQWDFGAAVQERQGPRQTAANMRAKVHRTGNADGAGRLTAHQEGVRCGCPDRRLPQKRRVELGALQR